ncbi:uncharacterized protein [Cardiocondyla obscurior]|uniref:uncharacterized protein isoform X1 n=1 Tax=Cardiocondyla obscurior TaxID=286306 RepID=UPI0039658C68
MKACHLWLGAAVALLVIMGASCLREVSLEMVPEVVQRGEKVILRCHYDLENAPLYSLKWYRGKHEFYRFAPTEEPSTKVFNISGINVDLDNSNKSQVTLRNVDFGLSGTFICEVTADAPTFSTASTSKNLTVVFLPRDEPVILSERDRYDPGDMLRANCSVPPSKPPVHLSFTLNSMPVSDAYRHDCCIMESGCKREYTYMYVHGMHMYVCILKRYYYCNNYPNTPPPLKGLPSKFIICGRVLVIYIITTEIRRLLSIASRQNITFTRLYRASVCVFPSNGSTASFTVGRVTVPPFVFNVAARTIPSELFLGNSIGCRASYGISEFRNRPPTRITPNSSMNGVNDKMWLELGSARSSANAAYSSANSTRCTQRTIIINATFSSPGRIVLTPQSRLFRLNRMQYATIRAIFVMLEIRCINLCTIQVFIFAVAVTIFFRSGISIPAVSVARVVGHCPAGKRRNSGPVHQSESCAKSFNALPRDSMSAEFSADGTCRQLAISVIRCISPTLFATNAFHFLDDDTIQCNATIESVHRNCLHCLSPIAIRIF